MKVLRPQHSDVMATPTDCFATSRTKSHLFLRHNIPASFSFSNMHPCWPRRAAVLLLLVCTSADTSPPAEVFLNNGSLFAACKMRPSSSLAQGLPKVYGQVLFKQDYPQGKLKVLLRFNGFPEGSEPRAVHVHQYGDLQRGCESTGGHYNPGGVPHPNHPGDFGHFVPQQGRISATFESEATLFGAVSVLGRSVVVHERRDDFGRGGDAGSLQHGNAGRRLGCCVIGMSTPQQWNVYFQQISRRRV